MEYNEEDIKQIKTLTEEACKYKIENIQYNKNINFSKAQFLSILKEVDPEIFSNKDKESEQYKIKKYYIDSFSLIKKFLYNSEMYKDIKSNKNYIEDFVAKFAVVFMLLKYTNKDQELDELLQKYGLQVNAQKLEDKYKDFKREDIRAEITNCFDVAYKNTAQIENNNIVISVSEFEKLPQHLKCDSNSEKVGLSSKDFNNLVSIEAMAKIKEQKAKEKVEKMKNKNYIKSMTNLLVENVSNEIVKNIK